MASKEWLASWQQRAKEVLQLTGASESPCPVCKGTKHYALPIVTLPWTDPPGEGFNNEGLLVLPLICTKCMHVRFFGFGGLAVLISNAESEKEKSEGQDSP